MAPQRLFLLVALLVLSACETTHVAPAPNGQTSLERDELGLWARSRDEQEVLDRSGFLIVEPEITAYLENLLNKLHGANLPGGIRFRTRILRDPTMNAFALPDGVIYFHTGILTRLQNEAQLATVLAHELTHATHRHALRGFRNLKNQAAFLATFTIGTGGAGALLGSLSAMSAISGYSRDLEREADEQGFRLYLAAGYDPRECAHVFRILQAESKRSKIKEPYFFGSHPRLQERIENFEQLSSKLPAARRTGLVAPETYQSALHPLFLLNAIAAQQVGDHDFARDSAERYLQSKPDAPAALLIIADSHRKRGTADDDRRSLALYRQLSARSDAPPEAHRGLGLMLFKSGDKPAAAAAFRRYLDLAPSASDRSFIENSLKLCEK